MNIRDITYNLNQHFYENSQNKLCYSKHLINQYYFQL